MLTTRPSANLAMGGAERGNRLPGPEAPPDRGEIAPVASQALSATRPSQRNPLMRHASRWPAIAALLLGVPAAAIAADAPAARQNDGEAIAATGDNTTLDSAMADRMLACTACHGAEGRAGADGYYPRIAGKPAGYLYQQLVNFRDGYRHYEPMALLLRQLPDSYLHDIARYFSNQHPPYPPPERSPTTPQQLQRGEALMFSGEPSRDLPSCVTCHGADLAGSEPDIPGLLGLPRDYLTAQLGAWQGGTRRTPEPDCMATVVKRLAPADLAAVTAWLSHQPVPPDYRPAAAPPADLPLDCHASPTGEATP
ncbi:MAG: cytochrome c [Pigmentiphaga sp.]